MEAKELRIGNFINYLGSGEVQIKDAKALFNSMEQFNYPHPKVSPIPLTEEWLIKFGFVKHKDRFEYKIKEFRICLNSDSNEYVFPDWDVFDYLQIKYVHQLQNLYFALTGEELNKQD